MAQAESAVPFTTVGEALRWAADRLRGEVGRPQLEAELLLAHVLHRTRAALLAHPEAMLDPPHTQRFRDLVARRVAGTPLPYIRGHVEFFGLDFLVTPDVLIPRPETEHLVELALDRVQQHAPRVVVDVGTGSGCIAVSLAARAPALRIIATDISGAALSVARANAVRHDVAKRLDWVQCDLLEPFAGPLDLILSNPPYVATPDWSVLPVSVRHEPRRALLAGPEGLDAIARLLTQAAERLAPDGSLFVEIGEQQGDAARALAQAAFSRCLRTDNDVLSITVYPDLSGRDRVLAVSLNPPSG